MKSCVLCIKWEEIGINFVSNGFYFHSHHILGVLGWPKRNPLILRKKSQKKIRKLEKLEKSFIHAKCWVQRNEKLKKNKKINKFAPNPVKLSCFPPFSHFCYWKGQNLALFWDTFSAPPCNVRSLKVVPIKSHDL